MLPSSEKLIGEIRRRENIPAREIAKVFQVEGKEFDDLADLLLDLQAGGQVVRVPGRGWTLPEKTPHRVGLMRFARRGHAFVDLAAPERAGDIYVPAGSTGTAFDGDLVLVEIAGGHRSRRPRRAAPRQGRGEEGAKLREGRVVDVIRRRLALVRGRFFSAGPGAALDEGKGRPGGFVTPLEKAPAAEIYIAPEVSAAARDGQKVLVRLLEGAGYGVHPRGEVVHVIEDEGALESDFRMIAAEFGFPIEHPAAAIAEAESCRASGEEEIRGREDLRRLLTFTIDPEDAKDFDDAVSLDALPNGGYRLGVHIADVSHYARSGSELDQAARDRGTSIYLPGRVVPMLPARISDDLASLRQGEDRLTKSVFMDFDAVGRRVGMRVARSVIRSRRRFTYEEALAILEKESPLPADSDEYSEVLDRMARLRDLLYRRRLERGSLELDLPRPRLLTDPTGEVVRVAIDRRDPSHHLIEEFMLAANEAVAAYLGEHGLPAVLRVHAEPDAERLDDFFFFLETILESQGSQRTSRDLQKILESVQKEPYAPIVHLSLLRSLPHAEYTAEPGLHYALATATYCHFTSPIRRYPDLLVHQILEEHLDGRLRSSRRQLEWKEVLPRLAAESSHAERRAEEAEREMSRLRLIRYLAGREGEVMTALVTSVHPFGFFVQAEDLLVDGLVHVSSLDEYYDFDPENFCLRGRGRSRVIRLGDRVRVALEELNPDLREIRFRYLGSGGEGLLRSAGNGKRSGSGRGRRGDGGSGKKQAKQKQRRPGCGRGRKR